MVSLIENTAHSDGVNHSCPQWQLIIIRSFSLHGWIFLQPWIIIFTLGHQILILDVLIFEFRIACILKLLLSALKMRRGPKESRISTTKKSEYESLLSHGIHPLFHARPTFSISSLEAQPQFYPVKPHVPVKLLTHFLSFPCWFLCSGKLTVVPIQLFLHFQFFLKFESCPTVDTVEIGKTISYLLSLTYI